jgi:hypothetical protein
MRSPRRTSQEDTALNAKRNKPPRMDGQTTQKKYQDTRNDSMMKIKVLLRKKPYHHQKMYQSLQRTMKIQNLRTVNHRKLNLRPRKCGRRKKQHH